MKEKIGFIGLGIMGKVMARHLLKAGHTLSVLQKNNASAELVSEGAVAFSTSKIVAEHS
ncbi:MAG: NAD(P)-binding domain-containing protein, partial [Ferruginibacter sp.]